MDIYNYDIYIVPVQIMKYDLGNIWTIVSTCQENVVGCLFLDIIGSGQEANSFARA